jgi:hypothetical protein
MDVVYPRGEADHGAVLDRHDEMVSRILEKLRNQRGVHVVVEHADGHAAEDGFVVGPEVADVEGHSRLPIRLKNGRARTPYETPAG